MTVGLVVTSCGDECDSVPGCLVIARVAVVDGQGNTPESFMARVDGRPIECNDGRRVPRPDYDTEDELDCTGNGILILFGTGGPYTVSITDLQSGEEARTELEPEFVEAEGCGECPYEEGEVVLTAPLE